MISVSLSQIKSDFLKDLEAKKLLRNRYWKKSKLHGASFSDGSNVQSCKIGATLLSNLQVTTEYDENLAPQTLGSRFEEACDSLLSRICSILTRNLPGDFETYRVTGRGNRAAARALGRLDQYLHVNSLVALSEGNPQLLAVLGEDYFIKPDSLITRTPIIGSHLTGLNLDTEHPRYMGSRRLKGEGQMPARILHASVSQKFSFRSDRAQNIKSEMAGLVKNRTGRMPHAVAVTCESLPSRLASLALGMGELDCVYHIALPELLSAVMDSDIKSTERQQMEVLHESGRLRDITDLVVDLLY